ncbi:hypothetical protein Tco_0903487 [Tanacetum coccineum]
MRTDELYKFSNGTLKFVRDTLHQRLLNFKLGYNKGMERRQLTEKDQRRSRIMMIKIDEQLLEKKDHAKLEKIGAQPGFLRAKVIENQVMANSVISISLDSSEESMGTSTARVILFGTIPTTVPATAPTVDLPVIHDDTPLIPTDTPTISPIVPTIPPIAPTIQ